MTESELDPERLAALLDGRLDDRARAEVLREIDAAGDAERAAFADLVTIHRELADEDAAAKPAADVRPFRREAAPSRWRGGRTLLVAASLAGVTFLSWNVVRSRAAVAEPWALVRQLDIEAPLQLPGEPWAVTRGEATPMSERGRAVRLGARLVDLEVAIAAGDSEVRGIAGSVVDLVHAQPMTGVQDDVYQRIANGDATATADRGERREQWEGMADVAGEAPLRQGAWLQAARIAVARRDAGFFRTREAKRLLGATAGIAAADERAAMERVRDLAERDEVPNWEEMEGALRAALALAGR